MTIFGWTVYMLGILGWVMILTLTVWSVLGIYYAGVEDLLSRRAAKGRVRSRYLTRAFDDEWETSAVRLANGRDGVSEWDPSKREG